MSIRLQRALNSFHFYRRLTTMLIKRLRTDRAGTLASAERYLGTRMSTPTQDEKAAVVVTESLPNVVPVNFAIRPASRKTPVLNVMIPGMALWAMSGGPNTVLNLTLRLARAGMPIRYISTDVAGEVDHSLLWNHLRDVTGIAERYDHVEFVNGHDRNVETVIGDRDVFLGTAWWTVQMIKHAMSTTRSRPFIYFIQDYEPGLYPWSTTYALALETYGLDFYAIVNESLLLEHLTEVKAGRFADPSFEHRCQVFEPAVDRTRFFAGQQDSARSRRRLLFYARPSAPRNLYELGIVALKRAAERGAFPPDVWDLRFMGDDLPPAVLTHDVTVEPLPWLDYASYAKLLRESDVGLSLMLSPHTGYPVLEMAACGMTVVTNAFGAKTAERLTQLSPNLLPAVPTVESVTDALVRATGAVETRGPESAVNLPGSWEEVFEPLVPQVLEMTEACRRA